MAKRERMTEADLKAQVAKHITLTRDSRNTASAKQTRALEYFQGTMKDVPAETGRSSVVSRDLADTMGWMLPGIIRVFSASEHMAVAEPVGPEDEAWADQATDGINHVFWKDNDGYRVIYNATWDSLLAGNGVVKVWWDDTPEHKVSVHSGLSEEQFVMLVSDEDVEVVEHTAKTETAADPTTGQEIAAPVHDVKIKRTTRKGRTVVEAIPPEDYGIDSEAKTCEDAVFQYHRSTKTRSDLIRMGFDRDKVEAINKTNRDESEHIARNEETITDTADTSTETVDLYECHIKIDMDGDGIAETIRVMYAGQGSGGEILDWEEWEDETPFHDIPCNPMPHRWEAQSIADETMDVQRVKTVLLRQALDNTYAANNPQRFVKGRITNPEELFSPTFGGAIMGDADAEVTNLAIPFVANHAYTAIEYQDQVIERRTGVSRQTMSLDPDSLQNQTATANQNARDAAYSQIELVARNQAELGWKKVFRKILQLEIKHQDQARIIRMRGKMVEIDPRHWNADMDISINVGLGTGSRDRDMMLLQSIQGDQIGLAERLAAAGFPDKVLDMLPFLMTTLQKKVEVAGGRSPEQFYPPVTDDEIQQGKQRLQEMQSKPDPKLQQEQAKLQMEAQRDAAKMQAEQARAEAELALKREQLQAEMALKREQLAAEMALKRELAMAEMQMKLDLGLLSPQGGFASSGVHMGGAPG